MPISRQSTRPSSGHYDGTGPDPSLPFKPRQQRRGSSRSGAGKPRRDVTIIEACDHPSIWQSWFKKGTFGPWFSFLRILFHLPLSDADIELYRECTGRTDIPSQPFTEAWLICGRRAGKSFILALCAAYLAVFKDWSQYLAEGELGMIRIAAVNRDQAKTIYRFTHALLTKVPAFARLIESDDAERIVLANNIVIEISTANFRSLRSVTLIAFLGDEVAFWRNEETAASSDSEIIASIRPATATVRGAMLLFASSPYARRGELYNAYRRYHSVDGAPVLTWLAPTRVMNSTVPQQFINDELERDPAKAAAEYLAEFRSDIESFVKREVIDSCTIPGRYELPYKRGINTYVGFVDLSGAGSDSMCLCVAHRIRNEDWTITTVIDAIREKRPPKTGQMSPEAVVQEFADVLRTYRLTSVTGDAYAGMWPREQFAKRKIRYHLADKSKSLLYAESLPLLNSLSVELLDHERCIAQLCNLERRTSRGSGRDIIDHPPGQHDDIANAVMGAVVCCADPANAAVRISPELMHRVRTMKNISGAGSTRNARLSRFGISRPKAVPFN